MWPCTVLAVTRARKQRGCLLPLLTGAAQVAERYGGRCAWAGAGARAWRLHAEAAELQIAVQAGFADPQCVLRSAAGAGGPTAATTRQAWAAGLSLSSSLLLQQRNYNYY